MTKVDSHLMSDKLQPCKESGHLASSRGSSRYKPTPANQAPPISCSLAASAAVRGNNFSQLRSIKLSGSFSAAARGITGKITGTNPRESRQPLRSDYLRYRLLKSHRAALGLVSTFHGTEASRLAASCWID